MKWFIYFIFIILYLGVTFFGLGPVLFADGTMQERIMTFFVVLVIYMVLTGVLLLWKKSRK
ncbi:DUF6954 family protein [Pseudoneobacillus rhizosphaerae]|jgi:hypothetical protein|uniref:Uncharacterized protein n=1 Tax=Pseudoneobacillus rhizosphaerae TaxID=2880968 RepID=A0A9C7G624_9BACI|nr:hypothetical protein [Pseudoneobacillus rhizosphaerae]CAG9606373.1 hypothetical protein NEOCIP111885_00061 [Pseudoneobacillus rhizosphaerae]